MVSLGCSLHRNELSGDEMTLASMGVIEQTQAGRAVYAAALW
jgi:hypothetical protein